MSFSLIYLTFLLVVIIGLVSFAHYQHRITYFIFTVQEQDKACLELSSTEACLQLVRDYRDSVTKRVSVFGLRYYAGPSSTVPKEVLTRDISKSRLYASHACTLNNADGCYYEWTYSEAYKYTDYTQASDLCQTGSFFACNFILTHNQASEIEPSVITSAADQSCLLGHKAACFHQEHNNLLRLLEEKEYSDFTGLFTTILESQVNYIDGPSLFTHVQKRNDILKNVFSQGLSEPLDQKFNRAFTELSQLELPTLYIEK